MHGVVQHAVDEGILMPSSQVRLEKDLEEEYSKGLVFDNQVPEILTRGHVVNPSRVNLLDERAQFSNYLVLPTKFSFQSVVRIHGYVMAFITKCRKKKFVGPWLCSGETKFSMFTCEEIGLKNTWTSVGIVSPGKESPVGDLVSAFAVSLKPNFVERFRDVHSEVVNTENVDVRVTDRFINMALMYLFRKGAAEVRQFVSAKIIEKHMFEKEGILLSKNRMLDCLDYIYTGELNVDLGSLGIKANTPVLDRYSPLAYSVAQHVHWKLAPHRGMETHHRVALEHVFIMQSSSLFRELSRECIRCNMRRQKKLEASMGGLSKYQLTVAPPFWAAQMDLFGPYEVYVPGFERNTRHRSVLETKAWVMCVVCPTSRLVNLQVLEKSDAGGIICGLTRLSCEVGMPKYLFCDQDRAIMSALQNAEFNYRDLQMNLHRQKGVIFDLCAVGGHDSHGHVERVIRSVQQGLKDCGLETQRLHATGLQSLCKLVENSYNSVPIGYSYGRDQDNSAILKIICPNMMRMGRTNQRTLDGPVRLARGAREMVEKVEELYDAWFRVWQDSVVPKLMFQPKWHNKDCDLTEGDLVYFQKEGDSQLDNQWTIGKVDQVVRGRDHKIRRVIVKYQNANENYSRVTDRAVRKLVKLFSVDEFQVQDDLDELQRRIDRLDQENQGVDEDFNLETTDHPELGVDILEDDGEEISVDGSYDGPSSRTRSRCNWCCCQDHCRFKFHSMGPVVRSFSHLKTAYAVGEINDVMVDRESTVVEDAFVAEEELEGVDSLSKILKSLNLVM